MRTAKSVMQAPSFKPELEFEVIKLVLLRERYIQRLKDKLNTKGGKVDMAIIGIIDVLRDCSVEVVETMLTWERTQISYPDVKPFTWNKQNYKLKMGEDIAFLSDYPQIQAWLGFSPAQNPFLVPPEVLTNKLEIFDETFVVFGQKPPAGDPYASTTLQLAGKSNIQSPQTKPATDTLRSRSAPGYVPTKSVKARYLQSSPYNTPVINDPNLVPGLTIEDKMRAENKRRAARKKVVVEDEDSLDNAPSDFFECYLSADMVARIRRCWKVLLDVNPDLAGLLDTMDSVFNFRMDASFDTSHAQTTAQNGSQVIPGATLGSLPWSPPVTGGLQESSVLSVTSAFQTSIDDTAIPPTIENQTLRLSKMSTVSTCKTWTPHELALQKVVHKRGGELFILTAASTKGRMKPPFRRTRFVRLEDELEHLMQQRELMTMSREEVLAKVSRMDKEAENKTEFQSTRQELENLSDTIHHLKCRWDALKYVYDSFKTVFMGDLRDFNKLEKLKRLSDGEVLPDDEDLSAALEHKMAYRIQCLFVRALAKGRREALSEAMDKAARLIQTGFRSMRGRRIFRDSVAKINAASMMKRINEKLIGMARMLALKEEARRRTGAKLIQRAWRGYKGREKIYLKRIFLKHIHVVRKEAEELSPGVIQSLIDDLEIYMHDYERVIPVEIVAVIRGIFYLLNGDNPESITVIEDDDMEKHDVFARSLTWVEALRWIRRKGRLLRRVRTLSKHICLPNACPLELSESCIEHLTDLVSTVSEKQFRFYPAKQPVIMLYRIAVNMKATYDLQHLFPEYFGASTPLWFRELLDYRLAYEKRNMDHRVAEISYRHLHILKEEKIKAGKKWGNITSASVKALSDLHHAEFAKQLAFDKMNNYMAKLKKNEAGKLANLMSLKDTTSLGLEVAKREVKDYIATTEFPNESIIKDYHHQIDEKSIALREVYTDIINLNVQSERDQKSREFEHLFNFEEIHMWCEDLGRLVSEMLILKGQWEDFIDKIGGLQFVADLYGEKLEFFKTTKQKILDCIKERRRYTGRIHKELSRQIKAIKKHAAELRTIAYNERSDWDTPYPIVVTAEEEEDLDCAKRDVEAANRKLKQPNYFFIEPAKIVTVLLIVDTKIPKKTRKELLELLFQYNYSVAVTLEGTDFDKVIPPIQDAIMMGKSSILFVEKGIDVVSRAEFNACFRTALLSFAPRPRVLSLDGTFTLTAVNWHSDFAPIQSSMKIVTKKNEMTCPQLLLGKVRGVIGMLQHCMRVGRNKHIDPVTNKPIASAYNFVQDWLPDLFVKDMQALIRKLTLSKDYPDMNVGCIELDQPPAQYVSQAWQEENTGHTPPYIVLAAAITAMLETWLPPITEWRGRHYREGMLEFLRLSEDIDEFIRMLMLSPYPITTPLTWKRVAPVMQLTQVWAHLAATKIYENPVIFILTQWALTTANFLHGTYMCGGTVPVEDELRMIEKTRELVWEEDILSEHFDSVVGDILHESLSGNKVFHSDDFDTSTFISKTNFRDATYQMVKNVTSKRSVSVYHSGTDIFVEVGVETRDASGKDVNHIKRYFNKLSTSQFISSLQPNTTEIYEGRIPKFVFDENFVWPEKVAEYTKLTVPRDGVIHPDDRVIVETTRAKYLQLSLLGLINGHFCRVEISEEGFGDLTGSLYGISKNSLNFRIDDETYNKVMYRSDHDEERVYLENYDASLISSIFADRLTIVPSKRMERIMKSVSNISPRDPHKPIVIPKRMHFRLSKGPGRLLGEVTKRFAGSTVIISVFEIHGVSDLNTMRIRVYEPTTCQTVEFRISGMERLLLFDPKASVLEQLIKRLRLVKIDRLNIPRCPILYLKEPLVLPVQHTTDSTEYDTVYDIVPPSATSDTSGTPDYYFGIMFDRSALRQSFGNVELGVSLALPYKGFLCTAYDHTTCMLVSTVVKYENACGVFLGKDLLSLMEEISGIDDSDAAIDLLEDFIDVAEIMEYEGPSSPEEDSEDDDRPNDYKNGNDTLDQFEAGSQKSLVSLTDEGSLESSSLDESSVNTKETAPTVYYNFPSTFRGTCLGFPRDDHDPIVIAALKERDGSQGSEAKESSVIKCEDENGADTSKSAYESSFEGTVDSIFRDSPEYFQQSGLRLEKKKLTTYMCGSVVRVSTSLQEDQNRWQYHFPGGKERAKQLRSISFDEKNEMRRTLCHSHMPTVSNAVEGLVQVQLEKSYVFPKKAKKNTSSNLRVCWRGRMMPKQFIGGDKAKAAMLLKRSARVIKLMRVENMKVIDDPVYLQDEEGAVEENVNLLPVTVYEILSEGPGVVSRNYRIEVSANNGEKLGDVDIVDDYDLKLVIGVDRWRDFLNCDADERDMNAIFRFIIENRIMLNLAATEKKREGGRREGISQQISSDNIGGGSVVMLQRDSPSMYSESEGSTTASDSGTYGRQDRKEYWLRIYSQRHRMSGRGFRTVVMFEGDNPFIYHRPDRYFSTASVEERFQEIDVVFDTQDISSRKTTVLRVSGSDVWNWLPKWPLDLAHVVRRKRFGQWLLSQLRMQYSVLGDYHLELLNMDRELTRDQANVTYYSPLLQSNAHL